MSFGEGFGAFMKGASGGLSLGKGFMDKKTAPLAGNAAGDSGKSVGFGLGQDLVSGKVGASSNAADASASSGPWSFLSGILGNLGDDASTQ